MLQPSGRKKCVFVGTVKQEVRRLRECGMLEEDAEQLAGCGTDSEVSECFKIILIFMRTMNLSCLKFPWIHWQCNFLAQKLPVS